MPLSDGTQKVPSAQSFVSFAFTHAVGSTQNDWPAVVAHRLDAHCQSSVHGSQYPRLALAQVWT